MSAAPAPAAVACDLCGLDCGRHPLEHAGRRFCCPGCSHVYTILEESGVIAQGGDFRDTEIFRQSLKLGLISRPAEPAVTIPPDAEQREALYHVGGLWCTSCGWLIEHALARAYDAARNRLIDRVHDRIAETLQALPALHATSSGETA